jgi:hypothetical protein
MSEFSMDRIGRSGPDKTVALVITLELKEQKEAVSILQAVEGALSEDQASIIGFNLFDAYPARF